MEVMGVGCFRPVPPDHFGPLLGYCDHQILKQMVRQLLARGAEYYSVGCHGLLLLSASADGIWQVQTQFQQGLRCLQRVNE